MKLDKLCFEAENTSQGFIENQPLNHWLSLQTVYLLISVAENRFSWLS